MSFNITSDGSPTPRKGPTRLSMNEDLRIDTSPEILEQAVGSLSHNHLPLAFYHAFGPQLTSNLQGLKRPLGPSALANQPTSLQQTTFDGYKVS